MLYRNFLLITEILYIFFQQFEHLEIFLRLATSGSNSGMTNKYFKKVKEDKLNIKNIVNQIFSSVSKKI